MLTPSLKISTVLVVALTAIVGMTQAQNPNPNIGVELSKRATDRMMTDLENLSSRPQLGAHEPYVFDVVMKDSSKKKIESDIYYDSFSNKTYLVYVDKKHAGADEERIYANQTIAISRTDSVGNVGDFTFVKGIANDTMWMFKALPGPISIYSYMSEYGEYFDPANISGIQLNDGPIVIFTEENLRRMMAKDTKALQLVDKKYHMRAIRKYNRDFGPKFVPVTSD